MKSLALLLILSGAGVAVYFVVKSRPAPSPAIQPTAAAPGPANPALASYITAGAAALTSLRGLFTGNSQPASLNPNNVTGSGDTGSVDQPVQYFNPDYPTAG